MAYNPGYPGQAQYPGPAQSQYQGVPGTASQGYQYPGSGPVNSPYPPASYPPAVPHQVPSQNPIGSHGFHTGAPNQNAGYPEKQQYPNPPVATQMPGVGGPTKAPWDPNQASNYIGPDIGADDVGENDAEENFMASAPSYDFVVSGYENVGTGANAAVGPPPSYEDSIQYTPAVVDDNRVPRLNDDEAREALLQLVGKSTCWGSGAAKDMSINDIIATNAYHYVMETYTEGRSTCYSQVPYTGGYVDAAHNGPAPLPWTIPCSPTAFFKTEEHKLPVPHTDVVRPCNVCHGRGFNRCGKCRGRGRVRCGFCHGHGHREVLRNGERHRDRCSSCHGNGRKRCHPCRGSGCVICFMCTGYGSVKQFIQLTVVFTNRHSDHIIEKSDLPDELIRNVQGDTMFEQTALRVGPIQNFFEVEINRMSKQLVDTHNSSWPSERILQQRHYLRSVPVHECHFQHQSKPGRFWVYGHQREVFTDDYPHTCCCCRCTIL